MPLIIPWWRASDDHHRYQVLGHCLTHWVAGGWDPILAVSDDDVWCKARALAPAFRATATAPVVVFADADVWCHHDALDDAVGACQDGAAWSIPHWLVRRQTQASTMRLLLGEGWVDDCEEPPYVGIATGGLLAIRADVARDVPMDASFTGWGGEDTSWGYALDGLVSAPHRPDARHDLVHLWHEPQPTRTDRKYGGPQTRERMTAYFDAWAERDTHRLRQLVEEGRVWPRPSSSD